MNQYELAQQKQLAHETALEVEDSLRETFDLDGFAGALRDPHTSSVSFSDFERPASFPKIPGLKARFYASNGNGNGIVESPVQQLYTPGATHVYDKREDLHSPAHSYKIHGARYALLDVLRTLPEARIVAAASAGNHGASLAAAVNELNQLLPLSLQREAQIYCREDASPVKISTLERLGATVFAKYQTLEEGMAAVEAATNRDPNQMLIHPFDQSLTIAGQATIAFEYIAALKSMGVDLSKPLQEDVPVGGGGLLAGKAIAWRLLKQWGVIHEASQLYGTEIEQNDSVARELEGRPPLEAAVPGQQPSENTLDTDSDGTATLQPGVRTVAVIREMTDGVRVIPKEHVVRACGVLTTAHHGRAPELAGALSLGGLLYDLDQRDETSSTVHLTTTTGSNITLELLKRLSDEYLDANVDIRTKIAALALRGASEGRSLKAPSQSPISAKPAPKPRDTGLKVWRGYTSR